MASAVRVMPGRAFFMPCRDAALPVRLPKSADWQARNSVHASLLVLIGPGGL